jgi:heme-degrading monooxygenase HmoA
MHHVVFEVLPASEGREPYLAMAARLKPMLESLGGCLALERFDRDDGSGWVLSMQRWSDEEALARWRAHGEHRLAQDRGRARLFDGYRLRVARRLAAAGTRDGSAARGSAAAATVGGGGPGTAPDTELRREPEVTPEGLAAHGRALAVLEWTGELPAAVRDGAPPGSRCYSALLDPDRHALVTANAPAGRLAAWATAAGAMLRAAGCPHEFSLAAVERDYGMHERAEAPARG